VRVSKLDRTAIEPGHHAVAVIFDFVQPLVALWRRFDQLRELRRDPFGQRSRIVAPLARYGARHGGIERLSGRCMRLFSSR
jgi:hypothetical protein